MSLIQTAERDFLVVFYQELFVIFGNSLVKPRWNFRAPERVINQKMRVFVKNRRVIPRVVALGGEDDVINVLAGLKITGSPFDNPEPLVGFFVSKDDDARRNRRVEIHAREKLRENVAELFELGRHAAQIFLVRVDDELKILRLYSEPVVFRRNNQARRRQKRADQ